MQKLLLSFLTFCLSIPIDAQILDHYGIVGAGILATQLNYNPTIPEDGTFQWNNLESWGVGIFSEKILKKNLAAKIQLNYLRKGFTETAQFAIVGIPNSFHDKRFKNKFNYMSLDGRFKYSFGRKRNIPHISTGARLDYLLGHDIESNTDYFDKNTAYPFDRYKDFNKINGGFLVSFGLKMDEAMFLEIGTNRDIFLALESPTLEVRNWLWFLELGFYIDTLDKKRQK